MAFELIENQLTAREFQTLRTAVGWGLIDDDLAKRSVKNSRYTVVAVVDNKTVGMARVVGDDAFLHFIDDVVVLPEYRKMGIGAAMMQSMFKYIQSRMPEHSTVMVGAMAVRGGESFYARFGFRARPNEFEGAGMVRFLTK